MCYHIISPKKFENAFSGKDELMGNLKAAALACGVVASVLGGGFGVAYITSSTVKPTDVLTDENVITETESVIGATAVNIASAISAETATTYNRTTTKRSYTAVETTAASKITYGAAKEGTTSQRATEAATKAAQISRSVPAPAHAPAAFTEPATQAFTTAAKVENITSAAKATTTTIQEVVINTTTTEAATVPVQEETTAPIEEYYYEEPVEEPELTDAYSIVQEGFVDPTFAEQSEESGLPISDQDFILLCNAVANEAGSNWIGNYDKAYVVEVIMNRVNSSLFPNSVYDVLTQRYQFSGASRYVNLGTYSSYVTQSVKDAVTLYFTEPESFTQGYLYFYGDGRRNYFR